MSKVLLVNGSPKAEGCTYTALKEIADTLAKEGVESEIFHVRSDTPGCRDCGYCSRKGLCSIKDDVNVLAERLSASTTATGALTSPRGTSAAASWNGTVLPYRVGTVPWNHDSDAVRPDLGRDAKIAGMNIAPPIVRLL